MKVKKVLSEASGPMSTGIVKGVLKRADNLINNGLDNLTDASFDDFMDEVYSSIEIIAPGGFVKTKDLDTRKDLLKAVEADPENDLEKDEIEVRAKQHGMQQEVDKSVRWGDRGTKRKNLPPMAAFEKELLKAAKLDAIEVANLKNTWSKPNRHHTNDSVIMPETFWGTDDEIELPVYVAFMDCSGSFSKSDINKELNILNKLKQYEEDGALRLVIKYFADNVHDTYGPAVAEGGTSAGPDIYDWVKQNQPANLIIMSDSDLEGQCDYDPTLVLDGNVWFIWKGSASPNFADRFRGRRGVFHYAM